MIFARAIELLQESETVKVFAPSGDWAVDETKDIWLKALAESDKDITFIAGRGYDETTNAKVEERLDYLSSNGVEVYHLEPTPQHRLGIILFDRCALIGLSATAEDPFRGMETTLPSHIETLENILREAQRAAVAWKTN